MKKITVPLRLGVILVIITLSLVAGFSLYHSILNAHPGDILFTPKLLIEKQKLDSAELPISRAAVLESLLDDRVSSFGVINTYNDCAWLQLADFELEGKINTLLSYIITLPTTEMKVRSLGVLESSLEKINSLSVSCPLQIDYRLLRQVFSAIVVAIDQRETVDLSTDIKQTAETFQSYSEEISQEEFTDQDILDEVTGLLLLAKANIEISNSTDHEVTQLDKYIAIETNNLVFENLKQILNGENTTAFSFQDITELMCTLLPNEVKCQSEVLAANWNSVNGQPLLQDRILEGKTIFIEYLNLLINRIENG